METRDIDKAVKRNRRPHLRNIIEERVAEAIQKGLYGHRKGGLDPDDYENFMAAVHGFVKRGVPLKSIHRITNVSMTTVHRYYRLWESAKEESLSDADDDDQDSSGAVMNKRTRCTGNSLVWFKCRKVGDGAADLDDDTSDSAVEGANSDTESADSDAENDFDSAMNGSKHEVAMCEGEPKSGDVGENTLAASSCALAIQQ